MKIVEINDNDLYGKVFNGYDIAKYFNENTSNDVKQIVVNKFSESNFVVPLFSNKVGNSYEYDIHKFEHDLLSVQSLVTITSSFLNNNEYYKQADIVHYHQIHNSHFNLDQILEMTQSKPTVLTFHDPWFLTGRCVHPGNCTKWQNGCTKCNYLNNIFDFNEDNCSFLWKIKKDFFEQADIDVVVASKYMYNMVKKSPYMSKIKLHLLPFGLNVEKFNFSITKEQARKALRIDLDSVVLFFREQKELKGTEYIIEALKNYDSNKKIVLLSCSQKGLLEPLKDKYKIIELGNILEPQMLLCYNACDIFLMPSIGESFGMMAIEAMASGKPVIVFNNTSLPEITFAPKCGVLVKNKDSNDLKEKINYLIENPKECIKRGELGKQIVKENYNIQKYNEQLEKIYINAYDRQKYKLKIAQKDNLPLKINNNDSQYQKLIDQLSKIYYDIFPYDKSLELFKREYIPYDKNIKIDFSNENIRKTITIFDNNISTQVNEIIERFNLNENRKLYKTKFYKLMRKSIILKKVYHGIINKKNSINVEMENINLKLIKLNRQNEEIKKQIEYIIKTINKNEK